MAFGESPSKLRSAKNGSLSRLVYAIWVEPDPPLSVVDFNPLRGLMKKLTLAKEAAKNLELDKLPEVHGAGA
jgi:hypothetical protein